MEKTCDLCGKELILNEGFWTCPNYLARKDKIADEHTAYEATEEEVATALLEQKKALQERINKRGQKCRG